MIFTILLFAISLSLDAFVLGISYGIKDIGMPMLPKILICFSSVIYAFIGLGVGKWLLHILGMGFANSVGVCILIIMGIFMIIKSRSNGNIGEKHEDNELNQPGKLLEIAIKSIGITVMVIKNPVRGDIDGSGIIDLKEALFLGIALNMDAITACAASSMVGVSSYFMPLFVGLVQLIFIQTGLWLGKIIVGKKVISEKLISITPGIILITLGLIKAFK